MFAHRWSALSEQKRAFHERARSVGTTWLGSRVTGGRPPWALRDRGFSGARCRCGACGGHWGRPLVSAAGRRSDAPTSAGSGDQAVSSDTTLRLRRPALGDAVPQCGGGTFRLPCSERPVSAAAGRRSLTLREMRALAVGDLGEGGEAACLNAWSSESGRLPVCHTL
ncbi:hypothetical protein STPH1_1479 [Streptomyces sp. OM5714]|nr:hypothetical protein STPH1_1479 [Streptomyces sp. OM5714]